MTYEGEAGRPLHCRFEEHWNNANNPTAKSYVDKPLAKHYLAEHPGLKSNLNVEIIGRGKSTINRKIKESILILRDNPEINEKSELNELKQFLV